MFEVIIYTFDELKETLMPGLRTHHEAETQIIKDLPRLQVFVGEKRVKTLRKLLDVLHVGSISLPLMRMLTQSVFIVFLEHLHKVFGEDNIVCRTTDARLQLLPSLHGTIDIVVHDFYTLETIEQFWGSFHLLDRFVVFELSSSMPNNSCKSTLSGGSVFASGGIELQ